MEPVEITLAVVGYLAIAFCIMRYSYPKMKPSWHHKNSPVDAEHVFHSVMIGLFFPVVIVAFGGYYVIKGFAWLITYQNEG
jgi:hypothetical protein